MRSRILRFRGVYTCVIIIGLSLLAGCSQMDTGTGKETPVLIFDKTEVPAAKPWTSENFRNDPENFQFAIIGDRTGGANVQGTFPLAMDQINLLQPEFVIKVGDIIEGYAENRDELIGMWDEAESLTGKLEMPFFFTRGNHDVSFPGGKEMWKERRGPSYYHFVYRDVLFMVLDSEAVVAGLEQPVEFPEA